jgi:phosphopantothenoylcysteine synthetase/decarboxylase
MGDTNKITIIGRDNKITAFELKSKKDAAQDIIQYLDNYLSQ